MLRGCFRQKHKYAKIFEISEPCQVGIHWIALAEYSQMSTHVPGFQSSFRFFASFCIGQISHQQHNSKAINAQELLLKMCLDL